MSTQITGLISLEQAKELVLLLESDQQEQADHLLRELVSPIHKELFDEIGHLTRQLHSALSDFKIDSRLIELTNTEIPSATERLSYVIEMTEQAANKTMDAVEECLPLTEGLNSDIQSIKPVWEKLMNREIELDEFKSLCHQTKQFLDKSDNDATRLKELLNHIFLAQDFQDLTGQVIRRVILLVNEIEQSLVSMLKVFKEQSPAKQIDEKPKCVAAEGPIINSEQRQDVVAGQDEVDDLLSSLGF